MKDKDTVSSEDAGEVWRCVDCKKDFKDINSRILECERCEEHHCSKCIKLSDTEYDILNARDDIHWYCNKCEQKVLRSIHLDKEIEQKLDTFWAAVDDRMTQVSKDVEVLQEGTKAKIQAVEGVVKDMRVDMNKNLLQINEDMNKVKAEVDKQLAINHKELSNLSMKVNEIVEGQEGKWTEVVKKQVNKSLEFVSDNIESVQQNLCGARAEAEEHRDRENRRNNVILYNITESKEAKADDRNKQDATFCMQLFNSMQVGVSEEDMTRVFRLGKRPDPDNPSIAPRPIMVHFASYGIKNLVMESLYKLKNVDKKFKGINIAHDMTVNERLECRNLVAEAKQKEAEDSSGEYLYRVRGTPGKMRIVQIKVRHRTLVKTV